MLEHQHPVRGRDGDRAAASALADDDGDQRDFERQAFLGRAGNGFRLPPLLGLHAGKGARRVDQADDRNSEAVGKAHQADRLPVALRLGHPEIVLEPRRSVVALLMADQHHPMAADGGEAAEDRRIVGEGAVPGQRKEILREPRDIILEVRPLGMARDLRLLPRGQLGISVAEQLGRLGFELADLGIEVELAGLGRVAKLRHAGFQLRDRLLEFEVRLHCRCGYGGGSLTSTTVGERMPAVDQLDQPCAVDVRVDLRRRNVRMAEQRLDHAQVRSAREQMRRESMPQNVRADPLGRNAGVRGHDPDDLV